MAPRTSASGARVTELERRAEVEQRLGVGVQRLGPQSGAPGPLEGLVGASRFAEMGGDRRRRRARQVALGASRQRVRGPAVEQAPAGGADRLVDDPSQRRVGKVVGRIGAARVALLHEQAAAHGFVQGVGDLGLASPARGPEQVGVDAAAEDGGCREHLGGRLGGGRDPGREELADVRRQGPARARRRRSLELRSAST